MSKPNITNTKIYCTIPLNCTMEFYTELCKVFPRITVTPETSIEHVMFNAGQQKVLDYVFSLVQSSSVSGDQLKSIKPTSFMNRALRKLL